MWFRTRTIIIIAWPLLLSTRWVINYESIYISAGSKVYVASDITGIDYTRLDAASAPCLKMYTDHTGDPGAPAAALPSKGVLVTCGGRAGTANKMIHASSD
ncbi:hypothetical protein JB92DRAFT_2001219 [Gautieria morchelliformis]|nr:hypothetical protein JB92DRAFT_2001219 [Gautieria morchelliformis]